MYPTVSLNQMNVVLNQTRPMYFWDDRLGSGIACTTDNGACCPAYCCDVISSAKDLQGIVVRNIFNRGFRLKLYSTCLATSETHTKVTRPSLVWFAFCLDTQMDTSFKSLETATVPAEFKVSPPLFRMLSCSFCPAYPPYVMGCLVFFPPSIQPCCRCCNTEEKSRASSLASSTIPSTKRYMEDGLLK